MQHIGDNGVTINTNTIMTDQSGSPENLRETIKAFSIKPNG